MDGSIDWKVLLFDKDHHHNYKASIGKITFWLTFIPALYFWLFMVNITAAHLQVLLATMTYNLAKKLPILGGSTKTLEDPKVQENTKVADNNFGERWKINVAYANKYCAGQDSKQEGIEGCG